MTAAMGTNEERSSKRRRLNEAQSVIEHSDHLCNLLRTPVTKIAVNRFKDFLASIVKTKDLAERSRQLKILKKYCDTQTASTKDDLDFPDLLESWALAISSKDDSLCSAIPAVLAQFYKTISGILEFREFGLGVGRSLLKHEQIRYFAHGLSAAKTREHLISPCLRLLTEIISFDGGALSARVFDKRDVLFQRLDFLLNWPNTDMSQDRRRPTVRRMALRLFIAALKFLDDGVAELASHSRVLRNCLQGFASDGDDIIQDMLKSIEVGLLENKTVSKATKIRIFNHEILLCLSALYGYEEDLNFSDSASRVRNATHDLLLKICTTRAGILIPQSGWYPVAFDSKLNQAPEDGFIDLGLDSPFYAGDYAINITVKNVTLSTFIQTLKLDSDLLQNNLVTQILRAAPELVADFFTKKKGFHLLSSDNPAWRSQFAFLFSVVQLPVPSKLGEELPNPPPVSIIIESLLPRPCESVVFTRYFTSKEEILSLSAARLLTLALEKLQKVLDLFALKSTSREWAQASTRLVEQVLERAPRLHEIVNALLRVKEESGPTRSALLECLAVYHKVLPEATAGSKFDIGPILLDVISRYQTLGATAESKLVLGQDILHMVEVARISSSTKWYNKSDPEKMSLFGQLLKFSIHAKGEVEAGLSIALESVIRPAGFLETSVLSFTALRQSFASTESEVRDETWLLFDNAVYRTVQSPVKYLDQIEDVQRAVSDQKPLSLLAVSVVEQWKSFSLKKHAGEVFVLTNIAEWIFRLYSALDSVGENFRVLQQFQQDMLLTSGDAVEVMQKALDNVLKKPVVVQSALTESGEQSRPTVRITDLSEILGIPAGTPNSLENIDRWNDQTDVELALQSGKVANLCRLIASREEEVRRKTFQDLQKITNIVDQSAYEEKVQIHLLLGELVETVRQNGLETPLPSLIGELAARLLEILTDPSHELYGKANKFLLLGPMWNHKRIVQFWFSALILEPNETDDTGTWDRGVEWLVQWLVDGLNDSLDIETYRRSGIYEKLLSTFMKPNLSRAIRRLILSLVWRGVYLDASMLLTRVGIKDWLRVAWQVDSGHANIIQQLGRETDDRCDTKQIKIWQEDLPVLRSEVA